MKKCILFGLSLWLAAPAMGAEKNELLSPSKVSMSLDTQRPFPAYKKVKQCSGEDLVYSRLGQKTFAVAEEDKPVIIVLQNGKREILGYADYNCEHTEDTPIEAVEIQLSMDEKGLRLEKEHGLQALTLNFGLWEETWGTKARLPKERHGCQFNGAVYRCNLAYMYDGALRANWRITSLKEITESDWKKIHQKSIDYIKNLETK